MSGPRSMPAPMRYRHSPRGKSPFLFLNLSFSEPYTRLSPGDAAPRAAWAQRGISPQSQARSTLAATRAR